MSNTLTIDGKEYVSATSAGKHFGYTKDYLLLLIKQGFIDGQKIGHKWYVNIPSAEVHFEEASKKRELRKKRISQERKNELKKNSHAHAKKPAIATAKKSRHKAMLAEALVVVIIGLSVGVTSYVGISSPQASVHEGAQGFFEYVAQSLYALIKPTHTVTVEVPVKEISTVVPAQEKVVSAHVGTTTYTSLVVAPDELFTASSIESIQDSFSDPVTVEVDSKNPQTGIITPIFKEGAGDAYRFLMVPVTQNTTQ